MTIILQRRQPKIIYDTDCEQFMEYRTKSLKQIYRQHPHTGANQMYYLEICSKVRQKCSCDGDGDSQEHLT